MATTLPSFLASASIDERHERTSDATICSTCLSLLIRPDEAIEQDTSIPYGTDFITRSAKNGCHVCYQFRATLLRFGEVGTYGESLCAKVSFTTLAKPGKSSIVMPYYVELRMGDSQHWHRAIRLLSGELHERIAADAWQRFAPHSTLSPSTPSAYNTGDGMCLEQISTWLHDCNENHPRCRSSTATENAKVFCPSRLIDVGNSRVHLVSRNDIHIERGLSYVTLTHKWRSPTMSKLLKSNAHELQYELKLDEMPARFRDAINVAQRLAIPYIWIDALCIIQDDSDDVKSELSMMGDIYRNATLNIDGLGAAEYRAQPTLGLSLDRESLKYSPFALSIKREGLEVDCFAYNDDEIRKLNSSNLMHRGWVLQERLLSPRSVYFGSQLFWECSERLACGIFPVHMAPSSSVDPGVSMPFRKSTLLHIDHTNKFELYPVRPTIADHSNRYRRWVMIVEAFTRCELSYEMDYLPALSGLAHEFQEATGDPYHAGIWRGDMPWGLLWNHKAYPFHETGPVHPKTYRAPSWSSASINPTIGFLGQERLTDRSYRTVVAEVLEMHTTTLEDQMGGVLDGYVRLRSHMRGNVRKVSRSYDFMRQVPKSEGKFVVADQEWFDVGYQGDGTKSLENAYFLLLAYESNTSTNSAEIFWGLIIEPVDLKTSTYRRIGAFQHFTTAVMEAARRRDGYMLTDYPEFDDFDPDNLERQTITII